jgi:decaprenylphospho-beta-D-ribofuranose 2-oxidase
MKLAGWGLYPTAECRLLQPRDVAQIRAALAQGPLIARGNGRAYGDSALNTDQTVDMRAFQRMLSFDDVSGQLVAEAGTLLSDIIEVFLPRGWFPAVTPGTRYVTLGGMVAADIHGKNHHGFGGMRACLDWIDLLCADGEIRRCSQQENVALFDWTCGGMGLTGIILRVALRLQRVESGWINQTSHVARNLDEVMALFETYDSATYSVAWIDCLASGEALGRSILMLGEHAKRQDLPQGNDVFPRARKALSVPLAPPAIMLNRWTMRGFNELYYQLGSRKAGRSLANWEDYFYPLDKLLHWNRLYGRNGFVQFQCVLPHATAKAGLKALLQKTAERGLGSFLAVLKKMGKDTGAFSFPMEGYTLALDFPVSPEVLTLLESLDEIVIEYGGRFYLAKDARMTADRLIRTDQRAGFFKSMRSTEGLAPHFQSLQSTRLQL